MTTAVADAADRPPLRGADQERPLLPVERQLWQMPPTDGQCEQAEPTWQSRMATAPRNGVCVCVWTAAHVLGTLHAIVTTGIIRKREMGYPAAA